MNANYDLCSSMLSLKILRISGIVMRSTYSEQKDHTTRHRQVVAYKKLRAAPRKYQLDVEIVKK